jgi:preprotein translocase subunit SecB|tara:strand:- start:127 stop:597 length:471 start_codon:yes stop_codon:yes gene_type:complete
MAEEQNIKEETTERIVALQTMYIKDVSFEAPNSPEVFLETDISPETKINLSNTHNKIGDDSYDVQLKVKVESIYGEKTMFVAEIEQGGVFLIKGYSEEEVKGLIAVFCPNTLFPFIRELVASLVTKGGFPALLLQPINFDALYSQAIEEAAKQKPN